MFVMLATSVKSEKDANTSHTHTAARPGKSFESSSSGKFRPTQCPQNSVICGKRLTEICITNVRVV